MCKERFDEGTTNALPSSTRSHRQFRTGTLDRIGDVEMGIPDKLIAVEGQEVCAMFVTTMLEVQEHMFGQRRATVIARGVADEVMNRIDLTSVEVTDDVDVQ